MSYHATGSGNIVLHLTGSDMRKQLRLALLNRYDKLCHIAMERADGCRKSKIQDDFNERKRQMERCDDPFGWVQNALQELGFSEIERDTNGDCGVINMEMSFDASYWETDILELLDILAPFAVKGCLSFSGVGSEHWRFLFLNGKWIEQKGTIQFAAETHFPPLQQTCEALEAWMAEIRGQAIRDDRPCAETAQTLLDAFEAQDPDGVLFALTGRGLHEHGVAAGVWPDDDAGKGSRT